MIPIDKGDISRVRAAIKGYQRRIEARGDAWPGVVGVTLGGGRVVAVQAIRTIAGEWIVTEQGIAEALEQSGYGGEAFTIPEQWVVVDGGFIVQ